MFATTVLLSTALITRGDAQSDLEIKNLDDVKSAGDSGDSVESSEEMEAPDAVRRLMPPSMRGEGEACGKLTSGLFGKCEFGLYCKYFTMDGSSTEGKCTRRTPWNPGFPSNSRGDINQQCNDAPLAPCNYDYLEGVWRYDFCTCEPRHHEPDTGGPQQRCNEWGPACNSDNLEPQYSRMYPSGESCECVYILGSSNGEKDQSTQNQKLGVRAPEMGGENQPCAYGDGCDYGLHPHYFTRDGSSMDCKCVRDRTPSPRPVDRYHGGLNQQCNQSPLAPCNTDDLEGVWNRDGLCTCEPVSQPRARRGEANGRCNRAPLAPCNHENLEAHYERLLPSGESCTCVYLLGASNQDVDENSTGPKLGRSHTGEVGEKCNTRGSPCNCHREPCDQVQPDYSSGQCICMMTGVKPATGGENERCNTPPAAPCNHANLAPHYWRVAGILERQCVCKLNLGSSQETAKLGVRAPEMGGEGEPCRNTPGDECDNGMYCKITDHGSWTSGVCLRQYMPEFGKLGQPCNNGRCDQGLHCKVTWHGSWASNVCERDSVPRGHTGEQCNPLGSGSPECFDKNDFCKEVHLLPTGTSYICTQNVAELGDRCGSYAEQVGMPTHCQHGLVCKKHKLLPSGEAQICEEKEQQGGNNEPCRFDAFNTCDEGLVCNYFDNRGPTCIYWLGNNGAAAAPQN